MLDRARRSRYTMRNCIQAVKRKKSCESPQSEPGAVKARREGAGWAAAEPSAGTALAGIDRLEEFLRGIGRPLSFKELGAKEEDIPTLVKALCYGDGREGTITGFVTLDEEDCTKIYQMMIGNINTFEHTPDK